MQSFRTWRTLRILTTLPLIAGLTSPAAGQCELDKLLASDGTASDSFGNSVAISGDVAIVGAHRDDDNGFWSGSAYIYRRSGEHWFEEAKLLVSDPSDCCGTDNFGISVSISGLPGNEVAIIGQSGDYDNGPGSGSAYIFRFNGVTWDEEQKLLASDGAGLDYFGDTVSISGPTGNEVAIVGGRGNDDNGSASGSAYIYRFNGVSWIEEQKLLASDGVEFDVFGKSVSIRATPGNEVVIVGAYHDGDNGTDSGSAYIFRFNGLTWVEEAKLLASDGAVDDWFGISVSISGSPDYEVAIVGAMLDDDNGTNSGSVYIFHYDPDSSAWVEETKLLASDGAASDGFGSSVSISGASGNDAAIVGAWGDGDNGYQSGSASIYKFNGVSWVEMKKLLASDGAAEDYFGVSVSISGTPGNEVAIVGSLGDDDNNRNSGSAYMFVNLTSECPADTDCDAVVDVSDLLALLGGWGPNSGHAADFNNDDAVNVTDLLTLLAAYGACP